MTGTVLNVLGILGGGLLGLLRPKGFTPQTEQFCRTGLGAFTACYGLVLVWRSINGSFLSILLQLLVVVLSLMAGRFLGRLFRLQKLSNHLGQQARQAMAHPPTAPKARWSAGFNTCAALYCAAPLGLLGSIQDGLSNFYYPLAIKAVMEGMATAGFARLFGWGSLASALPVLAWQGTLSLVCVLWARPILQAHDLINPVNAVGGFLVVTVAFVMLELKRFEIADYLPALAVAPFLTLMFR